MVIKNWFCGVVSEPHALFAFLKTPSGSLPEDVAILEQLVCADCVELASKVRERYGLSLEVSIGAAFACAISFRVMRSCDRALLFSLYEAHLGGQWHSLTYAHQWSVLKALAMRVESNPLSVLCCLPE